MLSRNAEKVFGTLIVGSLTPPDAILEETGFSNPESMWEALRELQVQGLADRTPTEDGDFWGLTLAGKKLKRHRQEDISEDDLEYGYGRFY